MKSGLLLSGCRHIWKDNPSFSRGRWELAISDHVGTQRSDHKSGVDIGDWMLSLPLRRIQERVDCGYAIQPVILSVAMCED
jgi:hypothetical protein